MASNQPIILSIRKKAFTALAIALQAIIVNDQEQVLPLDDSWWQFTTSWPTKGVKSCPVMTWRGAPAAGGDSTHRHPTFIPWMLRRAINVHHLWKDDPERPLQSEL